MQIDASCLYSGEGQNALTANKLNRLKFDGGCRFGSGYNIRVPVLCTTAARSPRSAALDLLLSAAKSVTHTLQHHFSSLFLLNFHLLVGTAYYCKCPPDDRWMRESLLSKKRNASVVSIVESVESVEYVL